MSTSSNRDGRRTALTVAVALLVPVLCCGLPLLIAAGTLGAVGSVLGNPWVIGAAVALLIGLLAWRLRRRPPLPAHHPDSGCCPPGPPTHRGGEHPE